MNLNTIISFLCELEGVAVFVDSYVFVFCLHTYQYKYICNKLSVAWTSYQLQLHG